MFRVISDAPNASILEAFLNTHYTVNPPTPAPPLLLVKGFAYTIGAKLCNFLGSCNQNAVTVVVVSSLAPSVSILGLQSLTLFRWQRLEVSSKTFVAGCDEKQSSQGLQYNWTVTHAKTASLASFQSISRDPSVFLLLPYSFQSLGLYTVSVTVAHAAKSATAFMQVLVIASDRVVMIAGGALQSFQLMRTFSLDGSGS